MKFLNYVNEKVDLYKLVSQYRNKLELYYDGDLTEINSSCQTEAQELAKFLISHGINAKKVGGYYKNIDDDYIAPDGGKHPKKWKHWWVETDKNIIDVTADQFHPSDRHSYRIIITNLKNKDYK